MIPHMLSDLGCPSVSRTDGRSRLCSCRLPDGPAIVTNRSEALLRNVDADLVAPFAMMVECRHRRWETMQPHEARETSWSLQAIAPSL
jgi:hypothetical protein